MNKTGICLGANRYQSPPCHERIYNKCPTRQYGLRNKKRKSNSTEKDTVLPTPEHQTIVYRAMNRDVTNYTLKCLFRYCDILKTS